MLEWFTEHDSRLIDLLVTNSKWVEDHAALEMLYSGKMLRTGSAKVDTIINNRDELRTLGKNMAWIRIQK